MIGIISKSCLRFVGNMGLVVFVKRRISIFVPATGGCNISTKRIGGLLLYHRAKMMAVVVDIRSQSFH